MSQRKKNVIEKRNNWQEIIQKAKEKERKKKMTWMERRRAQIKLAKIKQEYLHKSPEERKKQIEKSATMALFYFQGTYWRLNIPAHTVFLTDKKLFCSSVKILCYFFDAMTSR